MYEWEDLSDDELEARLHQRGMHPALAFVLVQDRDDDVKRETINNWLEH